MDTVGLRELRQQASELVRRVQDGEEVVITVSGRPSARLVPVAPRTWRNHAEVADLFDGLDDPQWEFDRGLVDHGFVEREANDPWVPR
jgi:prevent-host-death family protein